MNNADLKILERAFDLETSGALFQSRSKRVLALAENGFLEFVEWKEQTPIGIMTVQCYNLTHKGRMAYCETCTEEPPHGQ